MRNHCRVVITDHCNLRCDFCCMKDKEIHDSFISASMLRIAETEYDEVSITGGESLLVLPKVVQLAVLIKYFNPNAKIYLYTNGIKLTKAIADMLKSSGVGALNVSVHGYIRSLDIQEFGDIHRNILPIRILIGEDELTYTIKDFVSENKIPMRIWKMDDCKDMPKEDRFRIKDQVNDKLYYM